MEHVGNRADEAAARFVDCAGRAGAVARAGEVVRRADAEAIHCARGDIAAQRSTVRQHATRRVLPKTGPRGYCRVLNGAVGPIRRTRRSTGPRGREHHAQPIGYSQYYRRWTPAAAGDAVVGVLDGAALVGSAVGAHVAHGVAVACSNERRRTAHAQSTPSSRRCSACGQVRVCPTQHACAARAPCTQHATCNAPGCAACNMQQTSCNMQRTA